MKQSHLKRQFTLCSVLASLGFGLSASAQGLPANRYQLLDFVAFAETNITAECSDYLGRAAAGHEIRVRDFKFQGPDTDDCSVFAQDYLSMHDGAVKALYKNKAVKSCAQSTSFNREMSSVEMSFPSLVSQQNPFTVNFASLADEMAVKSQKFNEMGKLPSAKTVVNDHFYATHDVNVFNVSSADFMRSGNMTLIGNEHQLFIINVHGDQVAMIHKGILMRGSVSPSKIILNFPEATQVDILGTGAHPKTFGRLVGIPATIFAPKAVVYFNTALITGALYAREITGVTPFSAEARNLRSVRGSRKQGRKGQSQVIVQDDWESCPNGNSGQINPGCLDAPEIGMGCGVPLPRQDQRQQRQHQNQNQSPLPVPAPVDELAPMYPTLPVNSTDQLPKIEIPAPVPAPISTVKPKPAPKERPFAHRFNPKAKV